MTVPGESSSERAKSPDVTHHGLRGEPYHVGVVVPDLDEGMRQYGTLLGIEWTRTVEMVVPVDLEGEAVELAFKFAFARRGPVRLEITQEIPGTIWTAGTGLNHIGYWCDDMAGERGMLERAGCPTVAAIYAARDEPAIATMTRGPQGMYIELVSTTRRAGIEAIWAQPVR